MMTGGKEYGINNDQADYIINLLFPDSTSSSFLNIGELLIVGVPGEMTAELGNKIKNKLNTKTKIKFITIG